MLVSPELYSNQINAYKLFVKQVAELFSAHINKLSNIEENDINYESINRISEEVDDMVQFEIDVAKVCHLYFFFKNVFNCISCVFFALLYYCIVLILSPLLTGDENIIFRYNVSAKKGVKNCVAFIFGHSLFE